jgi:hypothetical protein
MFLGSRARPVGKADNLAAIYEPIAYYMHTHEKTYSQHGPVCIHRNDQQISLLAGILCILSVKWHA